MEVTAKTAGADWTPIREISLALEERLRALFERSFRKHVRIIHGAPARDRVGGKTPAVSIHLFDIHLTEHAPTGKRHERLDWTGDLRGLRLDYQLTAWTEEPLDEQALLDRIREDIDLNRILELSTPGGGAHKLGIAPRPSLKFENAVSFWSTMGWPPKVSLQYSVKSS